MGNYNQWQITAKYNGQCGNRNGASKSNHT
jgi:hypothetical protein